MNTFAERAGALADLGAPPGVSALAQLLDLQAASTPEERAASVFLSISEQASRTRVGAFQPLPELAQLLALDRVLPTEFGVPRPAEAASRGEASVDGQPPAGSFVVRSFEAVTPLLKAHASFAQAAALADDRSQWAIGAPQMHVELPLPPLLPAGGWRWRGRLTKHTELLQPLNVPLATEETIEITAEGRDKPDGSGYRRYAHRFIDCRQGPGLLELLDDSGWIELRGTAASVQLRIYKHVTVRLPRDIDEKFGAALPMALSTLLWMWAEGFLKAVALPDPDDDSSTSAGGGASSVERPPIEAKQVDIRRGGGQGADEVHVAVLGGGPAGMACAWLLSNPADANGVRAWEPPAGAPFDLKVTLVEKDAQLGGKAASRRLAGPGDLRVLEHGLHVFMGCYENLLRVVRQVGRSDRLSNRFETRIPMGAAADPADGVNITLQAWAPPPPASESLAQWFRHSDDGLRLDLSYLDDYLGDTFRLEWLGVPLTEDQPPPSSRAQATLQLLGRSRPLPRPLLRLVLRLWQSVAAVAPPWNQRWTPLHAQHLGMQLLVKRLALNEVVAAAADASIRVAPGGTDAPVRALMQAPQAPRRLPDGLEALARQLRALARAALPAGHPDPEVRLAGEFVELGTTVVIGLAREDRFPNWAIGRPESPLGAEYTTWASSVHDLDRVTLSDWLAENEVAPGFPARSRLLDAVTAGLFTTPAGIAAGTFLHGMARLFLTYVDAPYKMLQGGTSEAVIEPIAQALVAAGVQIRKNLSVQALTMDGGKPSGVDLLDLTAGTPGHLDADAFVVAMPPFQGALEGLGLPVALTDQLRLIGHTATLSVQSWTDGPARFPDSIVSGLDVPMRCAAAMDHLQDDEGPDIPFAPVYFCGEADDAQALRWHDDPAVAQAWLGGHVPRFQQGSPLGDAYVRVNREGSQRYVLADCQTQRARPGVYQTGLPNVWLAGDWTQSAFACGSIEAAVTSGLEAARHLLRTLGCSVQYPIAGPFFDSEIA